MNKRASFTPLEFDEETGKWDWPPVYEGSRRAKPTLSTVLQMEDVLWTLVHQGGEFRDTSGHASKKMRALIANQDTPVGGYKQALIDLDALGLITREMGPHQTYSIVLAIPVEQVPGKDPHHRAGLIPEGVPVPPEDVEDDPDEVTVHKTLESWQASMSGILDPAVTEAMQERARDAQRIAVALLDEVVKRASAEDQPGWAADRDHIAKQLEKANHRIVGLTKENEIAAGTIKALRSDTGQLRLTIEGLEKNLHTAIEAARELAQSGIASQETQQRLARLMTRIPGYDKGAE